jgi:hypothetical protein
MQQGDNSTSTENSNIVDFEQPTQTRFVDQFFFYDTGTPKGNPLGFLIEYASLLLSDKNQEVKKHTAISKKSSKRTKIGKTVYVPRGQPQSRRCIVVVCHTLLDTIDPRLPWKASD